MVLTTTHRTFIAGISGFFERNLWLMAQFYNEYQNDEFLQPLVAEISWAIRGKK